MPARRVHRISREDLIGIERQDNARRRDERARVAEQEELPVPLAVLVRRIVYDDGLGVAADCRFGFSNAGAGVPFGFPSGAGVAGAAGCPAPTGATRSARARCSAFPASSRT